MTSVTKEQTEEYRLSFFDRLLEKPHYLTSFDAFLAEGNTDKALYYWLENHCPQEALTHPEAAKHSIAQTIAELDHCINEQLNLLLHHDKFQKLESAWRGLWYLAVQADNVRKAKLKMLDITWAEVVKDLARAMEFDQSQLFAKIYSEEYDTPGGEPYGAIIADYSVQHRPSKNHPYDDIAALEALAEIAAAAFSPMILGASPSLLGVDDFNELRQPLSLTELFAHHDYTRWHTLREKVDVRFLGITLPRILIRQPYEQEASSYKGLFFKELIQSNSDYLWANATYAFGGILLREFASVGWFGHIRGVPRNQIGGGLVVNLPTDHFATEPQRAAYKPMTEIVISDKLEREFSSMGFIPLCQCYATPYSAFYSNQSLQIPRKTRQNDTQINAKLSSMLQHVLCGARFAHYIKVMVREKIGSFMTPERCEEFLHNWLRRYTTGRQDLDWEEQARYPLQSASVKVKEHPEKLGHYICVIHLVPYYQADQMITELELVTELVTMK